MLHRAGNVDGEGDGCGLLVDIPTKIWAEEVRAGGHNPSLALDDAFAVAHVFVERSAGSREGPARRARDPRGRRVPDPRGAGRRRRSSRAWGHRARGGAPLLAVRRPRPRGRAGERGPLQAEDRARGEARSPRRLLLGEELRLQGDGVPQGAGWLLPRPLRRALRDDRLLRAQPLLDQHLALLHPRSALRGARPQRRDQHDRAAAPGGADARDPDRRGQLRLAGPGPDDRDALQPRRPLAGRGDGDRGAADRGRDRRPARGAPLLLYVPAPADGPVRAGPGGADGPPRRRVRLLGRRARPPPAVGSSRPSRTSSSAPSRAWSRSRRWSASRSRWPRERSSWSPSTGPGAARPSIRTRRCCARSRSAGCGAPRSRRWPTTRPSSGLAGRSRAARSRLHRGRPRRPGRGPGPRPRRLRLAARRREAGSSRWPPTAPSRSARSATTARWPRSRPSARTWPTTSRRRSRWSPTRRSTASARSSTSPPGRSSAADPARRPRQTHSGIVATDFPVLLGGHHDMAPLGDSVYRRIAPEHGTYLLEDLWEEFRDRPGGGQTAAKAIDIACSSPRPPRGDRAPQAGGREGGQRRHRAAGAHRPHRLRRRPPLHRSPPGHLGDRPGAQAVPGRARAGEPAPALLDRPALGRDPERPRRRPRPRAGRQRRLPLRDGRGDLRRRLRDRRRQPLLGAAQGDREGDLDDRHPRVARLRPPVLLDRSQARAGRDLPDRGLRRQHQGGTAASSSSTPIPTPATRSSAATRRRSRPRPSASTRRSTRRRSRRPTAPRASPSTRRRSASSRPSTRSRCATSSVSARSPTASRSILAGRCQHRPPRLSDRDQLDELRVAVRAGLPRLRRGGQGDQHPLHQRRGRGDPGHVRQVPQVARPAGRLGPLRRLRRDAQLLLRRRDQDRPGREARRGRAPPRQEGLREGGRGPERLTRDGPDLALQQPRPLLDRGPRRADRRAEDGQPRPAGLGQGAGGPQRRHDRPRHRQGGRRHHHPLGVRGRHRRRAPARAPRTPVCPPTSAPAPSTGR